MSTHNLCFRAKVRTKWIWPLKPSRVILEKDPDPSIIKLGSYGVNAIIDHSKS